MGKADPWQTRGTLPDNKVLTWKCYISKQGIQMEGWPSQINKEISARLLIDFSGILKLAVGTILVHDTQQGMVYRWVSPHNATRSTLTSYGLKTNDGLLRRVSSICWTNSHKIGYQSIKKNKNKIFLFLDSWAITNEITLWSGTWSEIKWKIGKYR